jgi:hypothetical protein
MSSMNQQKKPGSMKRAKTIKLDKSMRYADILNKIEADSEVSFERVGDTVLVKRETPTKSRGEVGSKEVPSYGLDISEYLSQKTAIDESNGREIKISFEEIQELINAFSKLDERLASLENELKDFRGDLSNLKNTSLEKFNKKSYEHLGIETIQYPKTYELGSEETLPIRREEEFRLGGRKEVPEVKEKPSSRLRFDFITGPLIAVYNLLSMPQSRKSEKVYERTGDVYKEFQRKLFYLVRTSPRSLDEIAERTGKSRVDCMRWLRRMVDDGLLREMRSETRPKKIIYKIVLNGLN